MLLLKICRHCIKSVLRSIMYFSKYVICMIIHVYIYRLITVLFIRKFGKRYGQFIDASVRLGIFLLLLWFINCLGT